MGLGSAYRAGHAVGIARGFDVMVQIDADLSHDPADLPRLLAAVERGADLALGSRYTPGGSVPNWPRHRLALSVLGQPLRRVLPRHRRARHDRRLPRVPGVDRCEAIDFDTTHSTGYGFQIEMTYRVVERGREDRRGPDRVHRPRARATRRCRGASSPRRCCS